MMKGIFPDRSNQSLYTPAREDRQIASLQSNRSPSVSVMNLTQGIDGGTQVQQPRGSARSKCHSTVEYYKFGSCIINDSKYFFNIICQSLLRTVCQ